jgi:hypothetical protein
MKSKVRSIGFLAPLALVVTVATHASAWVVRDQPPPGEWRFGSDVAVGPDGNPVVAGQYYGPTAAGQEFRAAKYAAADGSIIWSYGTGGLPAGATANAFVVQVDANGDVVVGGYALSDDDVYDAIVVKLSGTDGSQLWRHDFAGADYQIFTNLVLTSGGDVVVNVIEGPFFSTTPIVYRLDGTTGAEQWSMPIIGTSGGGRAYGLAVDASDDVFVGAEIPWLGQLQITVAKLDAATGGEIWRNMLPNGGVFGALAVDALGNVIAAGYQNAPSPGNYQPLVAKFASGSGLLFWQYDLPGDESGYANAVAVDAGGDVHVTGGHEGNLFASKLDGADGAELWRSELGGNGFPLGNDVSVSSAGVPVVAGVIDYRFTVVSFDPITGDTLWLEQLPGNSNNAGYAFRVDRGAGYIYAIGSSVFPLVNQPSQPTALTLARFVDPDSPPVIGTCSAAPRGDCRGSIEPGKAKLSLKDQPGVRSDRLQWKLTKGEATTLADFGNPLFAGNDFTLCLYDSTTARIFSVAIPSGSTCAGVPCWRTAGTAGFVYRSARPRDPEGLDRLKLTGGAAGKMKIVATRKGRSSNLDIPIPAVAGLTLPLTIQLQQDGGNCFTSTFSASGVIRNDGVTFKALSD